LRITPGDDASLVEKPGPSSLSETGRWIWRLAKPGARQTTSKPDAAVSARFAVVDTNVVVSGLPPRCPADRANFDGMLRGAFRFLLSADLLASIGPYSCGENRAIHGLSSGG
jgi:hypothetical protein